MHIALDANPCLPTPGAGDIGNDQIGAPSEAHRRRREAYDWPCEVDAEQQTPRWRPVATSQLHVRPSCRIASGPREAPEHDPSNPWLPSMLCLFSEMPRPPPGSGRPSAVRHSAMEAAWIERHALRVSVAGARKKKLRKRGPYGASTHRRRSAQRRCRRRQGATDAAGTSMSHGMVLGFHPLVAARAND